MNDDLISRAEAIEWIKNFENMVRYYEPDAENTDIPIDEAVDILERVPSAEPQRKRGHWVFDERAGGYFCSECGRETYDRHDAPFENPMFGKGIALVLPYYCGYCGARMERSETNET